MPNLKRVIVSAGAVVGQHRGNTTISIGVFTRNNEHTSWAPTPSRVAVTRQVCMAVIVLVDAVQVTTLPSGSRSTVICEVCGVIMLCTTHCRLHCTSRVHRDWVLQRKGAVRARTATPPDAKVLVMRFSSSYEVTTEPTARLLPADTSGGSAMCANLCTLRAGRGGGSGQIIGFGFVAVNVGVGTGTSSATHEICFFWSLSCGLCH